MTFAYNKPPTTYVEYQNLYKNEQYELIDGELFLTPSPKSFHQAISLNIATLILNHVHKNELGTVLEAPMDVKLTETDVVQPDILFVQNEREDIIKEDFVADGPDVVVEVLSDSTRDRDTVLKKNLYFRHGVEEYWIVDPDEETVNILTRSADGFELTQEFTSGDQIDPLAFPDFTPKVGSFFKN